MNVVKCPKCGRDLIAEEISTHKCEPTRIESAITLYYSSFIPLKINGEDVAILISEDGKRIYNIKPAPVRIRSPDDGYHRDEPNGDLPAPARESIK